MKAWICLSLAISLPLVASTPKESLHPYAVKTSHLEGAKLLLNKNQVLHSKDGYSLVRLTDDQAQDIAVHVHKKEHNCGGLVDLSVDEESFKMSTMGAFENFLLAKPLTKAEFRIDNQEIVSEAMKHLSKSNFQSDWTAFTSFPNRFANNQNGVDAANWLKGKAEQYGTDYGRSDLEVKLVATPRYKQPSVVVRVPGKDSSLPGVLIGGHMDTYSGNKPGVDDDASGTIASLEVLRGVLASQLRFERDIYVVFYAAEEWGLHGSKKVANDFKLAGTQLQGIMQLDMISYSKNAKHKITFVRDFTSDSLTDFTVDLAKTYLKLSPSEIGNTTCGYGCSDHASWHRNGVHAVTPFEAAMNDMNELLHTSDDTMDIADLDHAFRFVQLGFTFVTELANPL